jgi:sugar O-acyltransferase (sialic acid O-acetyltransferase NeuD family)
MIEKRIFVLIGAGGHARTVCDAITAAGDVVVSYVDPADAPWQKAPRIDEAKIPPRSNVALGIGGTAPDALRRRLNLLDRFLSGGHHAPAIIHPRAILGEDVEIGPGAAVLTGGIVNSGVRIERGAIVNSGAIVEHDSHVGAGTHVAPGAILLGAVTVGACSMIGAGSVVLPGATVAAETIVKAATRYPG